MSACTVCGSVLEPSWKYCIRCGARTGVALDEAVPIAPAGVGPGPVEAGPIDAEPIDDDPVVDEPSYPDPPSEPTKLVADTSVLVYADLDIDDDAADPVDDEASDTAGADAPGAPSPDPASAERAPLEPEAYVPSDPEPEPPALDPDAPRPVAASAVLALVMGLVLSPLALLFGVVAIVRMRRTGERGLGLAVAGIALGTLWSVALVILVLAIARSALL